MSTPIDSEVQGAVLVVSIDRPETRNAMTAQMAGLVARQMDRLDDSPDLRVAVIHGRHGAFSSGMDLTRFRAHGERPVDPERGSGGLTRRPPRKPLIAAVEGFALGLGFEMVLACDLAVAAADSRLGLPEVRHGLVAAGGGAMRLPSRIARAAAMEMLLTGRPATAQRLHELGLVNRVTVPGGALVGALELAHEIAALPPAAVTCTKELVEDSRDWTETEMFDRQEPRVAALLASSHEASP